MKKVCFLVSFTSINNRYVKRFLFFVEVFTNNEVKEKLKFICFQYFLNENCFYTPKQSYFLIVQLQ